MLSTCSFSLSQEFSSEMIKRAGATKRSQRSASCCTQKISWKKSSHRLEQHEVHHSRRLCPRARGSCSAYNRYIAPSKSEMTAFRTNRGKGAVETGLLKSDKEEGILPPIRRGEASLLGSEKEEGILPPAVRRSTDQPEGGLLKSDKEEGILPPVRREETGFLGSEKEEGILPPAVRRTTNEPEGGLLKSDKEEGILPPVRRGEASLLGSEKEEGILPPAVRRG